MSHMMVALSILCLSLLITSFTEATEQDGSLDQVGLIRRWGYPVEKHEVTTQDGYILDLVRIPRGRQDDRNISRPVVLLMHGLAETGTQWILNLPEQSAGFFYADSGLDVFLGNVRGSTYGRRHRKLNPDGDAEFWNFSFDEMARYDLPAIIDKTLAVSGQQQLYYLGHSQGTLTAFILLSDQPKYNEKMKTLFLASPVATGHHMRGLLGVVISTVASLWPVADAVRLLMGSQELMPRGQKTWSSETPFAHLLQEARYEFISLYLGPSDFVHFNRSRMGVYAGQRPGGTSTRNILHWGQIASRESIARFDYDNPIENLLHYGMIHPPVYDYTKITAPMYLFWSRHDWLATPGDIQTGLLPKLGKGVVKDTFEIPEYNHVDFVIATNSVERVYTPILNLIRKDLSKDQ